MYQYSIATNHGQIINSAEGPRFRLVTKGRYVTISLTQSYKSCTWLTTRFGLHEVHRPQEKNRENYVFRRILKYYVWLEREQNWLSNGLFLFVAKLLSSK